jgi:hypothetical protein
MARDYLKAIQSRVVVYDGRMGAASRVVGPGE